MTSSRFATILSLRFSVQAKHLQNNIIPHSTLLVKNISIQNQYFNKMVDSKRQVSYEDMLKVIQQPEKVIIDVRNPDEVNATGKIPSSINIPLNTVQDALTSMSNDEFKKNYQREKPSSSDELIFYCQSGRRSSEALDKALKLALKHILEVGTIGRVDRSEVLLYITYNVL